MEDDPREVDWAERHIKALELRFKDLSLRVTALEGFPRLDPEGRVIGRGHQPEGVKCSHGHLVFERQGTQLHIGTGGVCLPEAVNTESDPPVGWVQAEDGPWSEPDAELRRAYLDLRTPPWNRHGEKMARLYSAIERVLGEPGLLTRMNTSAKGD